MDELKMRAFLHSLLDTALQLSETIDVMTSAHALDTSTGMIKGARTNNELEIARQLKLKRETPALPVVCGTCGVEVEDAGEHAANAGHWPTPESAWVGSV